MSYKRVIWVVLDGVGAGSLPDALKFGDIGSDTLGNLSRAFVQKAGRPLKLPHLQKMGIGNLTPMAGITPVDAAAIPNSPRGTVAFGRAVERSNGKDTTTGHWEMAGIVLKKAFPTFPQGFPQRIISEFVEKAGVPGILANVPASGTEIIKEFGEEHIKTGKPIIYTSADSVFQIAAHEEIIPIERLYEICEIARNILDGEDKVGRVIARPFLGANADDFKRTENRHDYAVPPPTDNLLPLLCR